MAQALYRKYRPQKLEDVLGQDLNMQILKNAAKAGRLGQAYIFYGARGTGKTTTARLIAKLLNCEKRRNDPKFAALCEPCNECRECLAIDAQNSMDVIEIDAASNRGIDEIRNLKENIKAAPGGGAFKVYIIDEAHMLTGAAWNALLKTLEEPPRHVVIIMATTEYEKLPATIISRAQRFAFRKQAKATIMEKLAAIAKAEKIKIDDGALELLAAAGEGSFRDAESLLEQVSSFNKAASSASITLDDAERITGRTGLRRVHELAALLLARDAKGALGVIAALQDDGHNLVQFTRDLIHYLRKVLSLSVNPALEPVFEKDLTRDEVTAIKQLGAASDTAALVKLIRALIRAYAEMRYSPFAVVPLEVAIVENLG